MTSIPRIITVENVSKRYRIGASQPRIGTLRDFLAQLIRAPFNHISNNGHRRTTEFWALQDVNFSVGQGEVVGIVGRNGAGKSTLLKILSRITEPTTGCIQLYGRIASLLEVGTGFHNELTGRENIFLNGSILGMPRREIEQRFDEIVAFAEVDKFIDTPVKHYSSGMFVRLAFAVAAHLEPDILIIDEVLSVGDVAFQKKCLGKMGDVAGHGRTVLFVSHNMEAVRKLCGRGILLEAGRIVAQGKIEDVVAKYIDTGESAQAVYDIPAPTKVEDPPGYAYKLTVEDEDGHPTASIPVGKAWQVRVHFRLDRPVEHFIIAVGLFTDLNAILRTCWSEPRDLAPGTYEAVFREETILLGGGRYLIAVGLSSFERSFHYTEHAGVINISDFAEGIDLVRVSNHGYVLNPFQIEILRVQD